MVSKKLIWHAFNCTAVFTNFKLKTIDHDNI